MTDNTDIDYRNVSYDTSKPPEEWSYQARRAYILEQELLVRGHPDNVNWSELARKFDKSKSTIHRDKERLLDYLGEDIDEGRIRALGMSLFESGLLEITDDEDRDPFDAVSFYRTWVQTMREFGMIEQAVRPEDEEEDMATLSPEGLSISIAPAPAELDLDEEELAALPERDRPDALNANGNGNGNANGVEPEAEEAVSE